MPIKVGFEKSDSAGAKMRKAGATLTICRIVIPLCLSSSCRSRSEADLFWVRCSKTSLDTVTSCLY